jgi:membrane protein DedA with SNARE-associated domain
LISKSLEAVSLLVLATIRTLGYPGVALLMAIESACIPLPSEVIMPFAGFLASQGRFEVWILGAVGAVGCLIGSIPAYYLGKYGGRHFIERHARIPLGRTAKSEWALVLPREDLDRADRLFARHGEPVVFFARLLPVVRTFIAFPAGVSEMPMRPFIFYTLLGSFPWCVGLAWLGYKLGEHWTDLKVYFHRFDALLGLLILAGAFYFLTHHLERKPRRLPAD